MVSRCSSAAAYRTSWSLRVAVSAVAAARCDPLAPGAILSTFRTYCMVSVEAPCSAEPLPVSATSARTMPRGSTAPCW